MKTENTDKKRPLLGCIRWDAMSAKTDCEKKSLSPLKWHDRVPFFLRIDSENEVSGDENTQEIIDRQIILAKESGIDYWAFVSSPEKDPDEMEVYALRRYLASEHKSGLGFCAILHKYVPSEESWRERVEQLISWFKEPTYVRVMGDRPLVYIFLVDDMEEAYGEGEDTQKAINLLREEAVKAGLGNPYITVFCGSGADKAVQQIKRYGLDALSAYMHIHSGQPEQGYPFEVLANNTLASWDYFKQMYPKIIPCVTLGFDPRCRWENPPPWGAGKSCYYEQGTPEQLADLIGKGLEYAAENSESCEAQSIIVYAWNEFCEGGWLCPTHAQGTQRLDAISKMLNGQMAL